MKCWVLKFISSLLRESGARVWNYSKMNEYLHHLSETTSNAGSRERGGGGWHCRLYPLPTVANIYQSAQLEALDVKIPPANMACDILQI